MASEEDLIIGIDLGTTNSCAAWVNEGEIQIIKNKEEENTTPSWVYFVDAEKTVVGKSAMLMSGYRPEYGVYEFKRFIGRPYSAIKLEEFSRYMPYQMVEHNGNLAVQISNYNLLMTAEEISSMVLQQIKEDATEKLGRNVSKAVITVPAHFTASQRKATLKAAETAGFTVMKLLSEPIAAALNYFFETRNHIDLDEKYWLVYDLGGGTFDVVIAKTEVYGGQQRIKILCVDGDSNLGGRNFDDLILKDFIQTFSGNDETCINRRDMRRAKIACKKAKELLSSEKKVPIELEDFVQQDISVPLMRQKFDDLCYDLFQKSIEIVDRCLKKIGIEKQDINEIILAGGSTRIVKIQKMLKEYFDGKSLNLTLNPELCVAKGAALQAAMLSTNPKQREKIEHFDITEVTSSSLGIAVLKNKMSFVIKKDTDVPTTGSETFVNIRDNQEAMALIIYAGEKANVEENVCLGTLRITNLTPLPLGICDVKVIMSIDNNGILTVTAKEKHKENEKDLETVLMPNIIKYDEDDNDNSPPEETFAFGIRARN